jgi:hypothetical protein
MLVPYYDKNGVTDKFHEVDDCDADLALSRHWTQKKDRGSRTVYPRSTKRENGKPVTALLSRLIAARIQAEKGLTLKENDLVNHKNHNGSDNKRGNLTVGTAQENQLNQQIKVGKRFKWTFPHPYGFYSGVNLTSEGKQRRVYGSLSKDENEAARAGDCTAYLIHTVLSGVECLPHCYNFPDESFEAKWKEIGERQRAQILQSIEKNGFMSEKIITRLNACQ